jgi:putative oxidoreductase
MADQLNFGLLVLRVIFGLFLAYHGYNKIFGGGKLAGTARWFGSMGFRYPAWQARLAAATEIGSGLLFAAGLLTPLAAAGMIGLMAVAIATSHLKNGFFIFKPGQGWEYCASIAVVAFAVATMGPGEWSLDKAFDISFDGWSGALVAALVGLGGAALQLGAFYRPPKPATT